MLRELKSLNSTSEKLYSNNTIISQPFNKEVIDFLNNIHKEIGQNKKKYSDAEFTFSFWCRKKNIESLKNNYDDINRRLGIGKIFHIPPSNTPINFAYSLAFGLLSGCTNIVRISPKIYEEIKSLLFLIIKLAKFKKYKEINKIIFFVKYESDSGERYNTFFSKICDARIIWGGDNTIQKFKTYKTQPHNIDIPFYDRYSLSIIDANYIAKLNKDEILKIARLFYNDTYYVDQNACSSPHLVSWIGNKNKNIDLFWNMLETLVSSKYSFIEISSIDKYTQLIKNITSINDFDDFINHSNLIFRFQLKNIPKNISDFRGRWGYFYEYYGKKINFLKKIVNRRFQTLTYIGFNEDKLIKYIVNNKLKGIDRIVPVGRSLEIGLKWDGYDIIRILSRYIAK